MDETRRRKEEAAAAAAAPKPARPAVPANGPASGTSVPSAAGENRPANAMPTTLAEAKQRLQRIQEAAIQQAAAQQGGSAGPASGTSVSKPTLELKPLALGGKPPVPSGGSAAASGSTAPRAGSQEAVAGPQTYEISPYKCV